MLAGLHPCRFLGAPCGFHLESWNQIMFFWESCTLRFRGDFPRVIIRWVLPTCVSDNEKWEFGMRIFRQIWSGDYFPSLFPEQPSLNFHVIIVHQPSHRKDHWPPIVSLLLLGPYIPLLPLIKALTLLEEPPRCSIRDTISFSVAYVYFSHTISCFWSTA